jgi:pimeloyl-ACP methyl ester carboxylesterase
MVGALRGMRVTQARLLPALQGFDLLANGLHVPVPVAVFQGRHDVGAPPHLAAALATHLGAELVWFEDSAHTPHEEEPARFRAELRRVLGHG